MEAGLVAKVNLSINKHRRICEGHSLNVADTERVNSSPVAKMACLGFVCKERRGQRPTLSQHQAAKWPKKRRGITRFLGFARGPEPRSSGKTLVCLCFYSRGQISPRSVISPRCRPCSQHLRAACLQEAAVSISVEGSGGMGTSRDGFLETTQKSFVKGTDMLFETKQ